MKTIKEKIYLAALLHDIGKFAQRADSYDISSSKMLFEQDKIDIASFCPFDQNQKVFTHKHVLWTASFITKYKAVFDTLETKDEVSNNISLKRLATCHHMPPDTLSHEEKIIWEANQLSNGMDYKNKNALNDEVDSENWGEYIKKRLDSIFERINREPNAPTKFKIPVRPMGLDKDFFPQSEFDSAPDYSTLWKNFEKEFKFIHSNNFKAYGETLLNLLLKYTSTVPSSTVNFSDVSLYDHARTSASIAVCLYEWSLDKNQESEPFLMIGADFSGIQSYIYNIISKSAAKNLKGRSFYIKLLSDAIVQYLIKELELFEANIIYNAGGGFFILTPNTSKIRERLKECVLFIEDRILEAHGTSIYVSIDSVKVGKEAFLGQGGDSIKKYWDLLFVRRNEHKRRRYADRLEKEYDNFFSPINNGGESRRDAITGEEILGIPISLKGKTVDQNYEDEVISEITWKQIELGKKLKSTNYWIVADRALEFLKDTVFINPAELGIYFYFLSKEEFFDKLKQLNELKNQVKILSVNGNIKNECDFLTSSLNANSNIWGIEFYGGNDFPQDEYGHPISFDQLCKGNELKRLGILRMDVDNLGSIFRHGVSSNMNSFSRYAALSRNLGWFFSGYINTLWKEFRNNTFIVYSGGDDLFLIGDWSEVMDFGKKIHQDFKKFVCENSSLSLSGGLIIVTPKYPIKKGAADCDEAEKLAKSYRFYESNGKITTKNSICFMGMPLQWNNEFLKIEKTKNELVELLSKGDLPRSFISKINIHAGRLYRDDANKVNIDFRLYWKMAYDFGRMNERIKNTAAKSLINRCKLDAINNTFEGEKNASPYHSMELWQIAARWAELELR